MNEEVRSLLPSAGILGVAVVIALFLSFTRDWAGTSGNYIRGAVRIAMVTVLFQAVHFAEELFTGFHERFPALFGLAPMALGVFVSFNLAWLVIWSLSVWGLAARNRVALFPLWFLSLGCIGNGVAHPSFSVLVGGYFPGLVTSPIVGVLGVLLLRRLLSITDAVNPSPGAA